ncbi:unnamed protein product [Trichobilharzia regenti]|nr:unnamed protein product [Trichobilharzia regenti]
MQRYLPNFAYKFKISVITSFILHIVLICNAKSSEIDIITAPQDVTYLKTSASAEHLSLRADNNHNKFLSLVNSSNNDECISENTSVLTTSIIFILSLIVALATAGGNFLVILAVILVKKLQTPSNILIALLVLPFTIIDAFKGYWPFNEGLCDMYISFDVLLCTASILNLCAISIDRYLVITKPLTYASRRTPCRMAAMIAAAWIGSALISIPPNFGWKEPFQKCACEYSKNVGYQVYATFFAFYLPLFVMIILYGRIFKLAREMSRTGHTQMTPSTARKSTGIQENAYMDPKVGCITDQQAQNELQFTETSTADGHNRTNENVNGVKSDKNASICCESREKYERLNSNSSRKLLTDSTNLTNDINVEINRRRSRGNSDTKVIKTLGVIMGCFCLCWLPFFMIQVSVY